MSQRWSTSSPLSIGGQSPRRGNPDSLETGTLHVGVALAAGRRPREDVFAVLLNS